MDNLENLPNRIINDNGPVSEKFLALEIKSFTDACRHVHQIPYGYNSDRDDLMILFKENMGSCTTKHSVIATLAQELELPVHKTIGIYAMTEIIVTGTDKILNHYNLPFIPMVHCFLAYKTYRVDLTEGNNNGKNRSIETFLYTQKVEANISAKNEYLLYRRVLQEILRTEIELKQIETKTILHAREDALKLLKDNIN